MKNIIIYWLVFNHEKYFFIKSFYLLVSLKKNLFLWFHKWNFLHTWTFHFFFFSWFYTWTFFFPSWKKVYSWIIFYFYNCIFRIKIWKKGIKRLSWGQEKRKINRFTKKILLNFFFFPHLYFIVKHFSFLHEKRCWRLFFFFYSVTWKKNIFPPGFTNKKYLDSIMKKKDKKSLTKWKKKFFFQNIFPLIKYFPLKNFFFSF